MLIHSWHRHRRFDPLGSTMTKDWVAVGEKRYAPSHDEIARLAYSYWQARREEEGGSAMDDWLRAEKDLTRRMQR